ncbi:MAG: FlgD immunoglobulin-like domain containing protein, partial [bacterium]
RPGGTGCYDISLMTTGRVGGVQAQVTIVDRSTGRPVPSELLHPTSVEAVGRASSFQAAWTAEGSVLRVLLYSSTGGVIEPGDGPILHVCYAIGERAPVDAYSMHFTEGIVADPSGDGIAHCPTFAEIVGVFCVEGERSCDLNSDGVSDIRDIVLLVRCALSGGIGGTVDCPDPLAGHADCNSDGSVDVRDVICCVRNVLETAGLAYQTLPASTPPADPATTDMRFEGPVQWTSATSGWAMLRVTPGIDVAGIQFGVSSLTRSVRVRSFTMVEAGNGVAFEWTSQPPAGSPPKGILYRPAGDTRLEGPIRIRVDVETTPETGGFPYLSVVLQAANVDGSGSRTTSETASIPSPGGAPTVTAAAPNPFTTETEIAFSLPATDRVTIRIYDATGRLVRTLVDSTVPAGVYRERWDGKDNSGRSVASGLYFFKFKAGTAERTQRILRLR